MFGRKKKDSTEQAVTPVSEMSHSKGKRRKSGDW